jgi:serine/threonine-protein kinase
LRGEEVTPKSDVYSLGVTLYHAATGQAPFAGSPIEVASQHVSKDPTPPRRLNDAVSASLDALILDCLKKDPNSRPSADEVRIGLLEVGRGVHATEAYAEAPAMETTKAEQPTRSSPTREAPPPRTVVSRPGVAALGSRRRWARGALVILALVAVLAVIAALALPTLLGRDGERGEAAQNKGGPAPSGGGQAQGEQDPQGASDQQSASQSASAPATSEPQGQDGLTQEAAEQTVQEFYVSAVRGDTSRAYELLTDEWRQRYFPTQAELEGTFEPVQAVTFVEGPTAEVTGDTATVTGRTRATLTDQIEQNEGTWRLVSEGGEWRINEWTVNNISTRPA